MTVLRHRYPTLTTSRWGGVVISGPRSDRYTSISERTPNCGR